MHKRTVTDFLDDMCSKTILSLMERQESSSHQSSSSSSSSPGLNIHEHRMNKDDISSSSPCLKSSSSNPLFDTRPDPDVGIPPVSDPAVDIPDIHDIPPTSLLSKDEDDSSETGSKVIGKEDVSKILSRARWMIDNDADLSYSDSEETEKPKTTDLDSKHKQSPEIGSSVLRNPNTKETVTTVVKEEKVAKILARARWMINDTNSSHSEEMEKAKTIDIKQTSEVREEDHKKFQRWMKDDSDSFSEELEETKTAYFKQTPNPKVGGLNHTTRRANWQIASNSDSEIDNDQAVAAADKKLFHSSDSEANETHKRVQKWLNESNPSPNISLKEEEDGVVKDDIDLDLDGLNDGTTKARHEAEEDDIDLDLDEGAAKTRHKPMQVAELVRNYVLNQKQSIVSELIMAERFFDIDSSHLATVICAMLNSKVGGNIFIGVKANGLIRGVKMDRKKRDKMRQLLDKVCGQHLIPRCSPHDVDIAFNPVRDQHSPPVMELWVIVIKVEGQEEVRYQARHLSPPHQDGVYVRKMNGNQYTVLA